MFPPRPDFLVISPPKTGTTWLADNLRHHPDLYVPAVKEVKYFSSLHRVLDLDWYRSQFEPAGGRRAGDVSPSYAALPAAVIRRVRDHFPHLKLVFLMRDPVGRAWSHAKHMHRYREATFGCFPPGPATVDQWRAALADEWSLLGGDYLGHLRRWASVFPPERMFLGFYEDIAARPADLLRRVFRFLGVDPDVDLSPFPLHERILAGAAGALPPELEAVLRGLLGPRTVELAAVLRERFGLTPPEWRLTLGPGAAAGTAPPEAFARAADDAYVAAVGAREDTFLTAYREIEPAYRGHDLVFLRGRLLAVGPDAREPVSRRVDNAAVDQLLAAGACLTADSLPALKERVTDAALARLEGRLRAVEASAEEARAAADRAAAELRRLTSELRRETLAARVVRRARRLASWVAAWAATGSAAA